MKVLAMSEIDSAATSAVRALATIETKNGAPSTVSRLTRVDMALYPNAKNNGYNYYVNEVTRMPFCVHFCHDTQDMVTIGALLCLLAHASHNTCEN
jgi:hypothetical protein